ncbi:MAG: hypothetical protein ABIN91_00635 [Mucilaginibacter sp.]|uniref:hypothetical protein n=1 Tax=Mucilaginibacter sp. TaxID=1882438 RepID=UPI0032648ADF
MDNDIVKQLEALIDKLRRLTYDEAKTDPEFKNLTPKQFERYAAEQIKTVREQLARLKK